MQDEKFKLLLLWRGYIFRRYTLSEVVRYSNRKTKTWVFNAMKLLAANKLLLIGKTGNVNVYRFNLANPFVLQALQYLEAKEHADFSQIELIGEVISSVPVHNYCLLVFGSYVKKPTKKSDLDLCFLVEDEAAAKKIKPYVRDVSLKYPVDIDDHYVTFDDFIRMLIRKEENLGKQIYRKHILFFNPDIYYALVKEAYQRGFRA